MTEKTELRRLLVLCGPGLKEGGVLDFLCEHFEVQLAEDLDEALASMRGGHVDAVLAETADFLPLERGIVTQHASVVLDTIGDGVCIVGAGGELVWANRRLRGYPQRVLEELRGLCVRAYEQFAGASVAGADRGKRFSLLPGDGMYFEVICSPVRDGQGLLRQVAAVVVDATNQRRQQLKLNAIERAGRELVRLDRDVIRRDAIERFRLLKERIISCSRDVLNYEHFAVLLLNERTNRLEVVVFEGLDELVGRYELFASTQNNGICGYVASTGGSYVCPDVRKDPRYLPGLSDARSSLTVPLRLHDRIIGVLNVESGTPSAFDEEDRQFAEIFGNYVAMALQVLDLLVRERHTTHTQVSGTICAELAGPLDDLLTGATEIQEDYIGHDSLRQRLGALIDLATRARRTVQQASEAPKTGVFLSAEVPVQEDPVFVGRGVLVADNEETMRQTIRDVLAPLGCEVDVASDGAEAMDKIAAHRFDLVISDIKMPSADGYDVLVAAKAADPDTQVILITAFGYDADHTVVRANREGLAAVLLKPFEVKDLLDQCRAALASVPR